MENLILIMMKKILRSRLQMYLGDYEFLPSGRKNYGLFHSNVKGGGNLPRLVFDLTRLIALD